MSQNSRTYVTSVVGFLQRIPGGQCKYRYGMEEPLKHLRNSGCPGIMYLLFLAKGI